MKKHQVFLMFLALILVIIGVILIKMQHHEGNGVSVWKIYRGQYDVYNVEIQKSEYGDWRTEIFVNLHKKENSSYVSISGRDYDADQNWDIVTYCGYPDTVNGCNSVVRTENGWAWSPCSSDEEKGLKRFTQQEIDFAIDNLDKAKKIVLKKKYLESNWRRSF
jgi:hypothetical protein